MDKEVIKSTEGPVIRLMPDVNILKIGGQSIIDRGKAGLYPVIDEIAQNIGKHKMVIGVGGGTRSRHVYSIAIDLGLPTGLLAYLGGATSEQNAHMVQALLAKHSGIRIPKDHFEEIPLYMNAGCTPVITGMPPYHYWEHIPKEGRIPPHRTDAGVYLLAEVFGLRSMTFIKDEDGLFTADPKKDKKAKFIPKISVQELLEMDLNDLPIERSVLELMMNAKHATEVQIVNGLKPGNITKALDLKHAGTIIYRA
jgi:molybdenum storage protein